MSLIYQDDDFVAQDQLDQKAPEFPIMRQLLERIQESDPYHDRIGSYIFESNATLQLKSLQEEISDSEKSQQLYPTVDSLQGRIAQEKNPKSLLDIAQYNTILADESKKTNLKMRPEKRLLDQFVIKLKRVLHLYILSQNPNVDLKKLSHQLNNLPTMKKSKSMKEFHRLYKINEICGVPINIPEIAVLYLQSNTSLLDGLFPRENKNGDVSKKQCKDGISKTYILFLSTYELMSKVFDAEADEMSFDGNYQNLWYYQPITPVQYQQFDAEG